MKPALSILEITVCELFSRLRKEGFRYAVLRNGENYPNFGHDIDLVMDSNSVSDWRFLIISVAQTHGWDAVVECDHWSQSKSNHHNIQVFRLLKWEPAACLQIDLFHGYCLWGLPLMTEAELLESRSSDERGFMKIDPAKENFFKLLQLHRLYAFRAKQANKIERYQKHILEYANSHLDAFNNILNIFFERDGHLVLEALQSGDALTFSRLINNMKLRYFCKQFLEAPRKTILATLNRFVSHFRAYGSNPCGLKIQAYAPSEACRKQLSNTLDELKSKNFIPCWGQVNFFLQRLFTFAHQRRILERGGLVIQWEDQLHKADLDLSIFPNSEALRNAVIALMIDNHQLLYNSGRVP